MFTLTAAAIAPSVIAAERARLSAATERIAGVEEKLAALQRELEEARAEQAQLRISVQWRELMAAVNADDDVYAVTERLMETFTAFRESLVEPATYKQEQEAELNTGDDIVPYSDTDDYADFSSVEATVEELLAAAKDQLECHAAAAPPRHSNRSSPSGSFNPASGASAGASPAPADGMQARRQALLQLLVITVLTGKAEEYCDFASIPDPSNAPRSEAEEVRDGVASVWQWLFFEKPWVLTAAERAEWMDIAQRFLGEGYAASP